MKKYELTDEEKVVYGVTLHRIRALRKFADVKKGDLGGWVQGEENLDQEGDAWVYGNARVYGGAGEEGIAFERKGTPQVVFGPWNMRGLWSA